MSDDRKKPPPLRVPDNIQWGREKPKPAAAQVKLGAPPPLPPPPAPRGHSPAAARVSPAAAMAGVRGSTPSPARRRPRPAGPAFYPKEPRSWVDAGLDPGMCEQLILRYLRTVPKASGRQISEAVCIALSLVREITNRLKTEKAVSYVGTNVVGDFICELAPEGVERADAARRITSYVGAAPVLWEDYLKALKLQTLKGQHPGPDDLHRAFTDLSISEELLEALGPAITSSQPLFLHGEPGNGKTSIAERITACFGDSIWIPKTLLIQGTLVKLYDPALHHEVETDFKTNDAGEKPDRRWIQITRPTVIAGGELTLDMLELQHDLDSAVSEAPLHLKANMGTFVIDDFGRGKTSPMELLNRWIFPLEKHIDFLQLPDGRKMPVPFDCMLVFSTNLEPRDLADEAFLRRIPYKVYVHDPDEEEFAALVEAQAGKLGVRLVPHSVKYLVDRHYKSAKRDMRFCHPRDLLKQVVYLAEFRGVEPVAGPQEWDHVVKSYFGSF